MIVVADTSPLNYLVLIDQVDVLRKLYGAITIPPQVLEELNDSQTPASVRAWMRNPPVWLEVRSPSADFSRPPVGLDAGEWAAIELAEELVADQIILDELKGRQQATLRGLDVIGTLGVLREANRFRLLDLRSSIERLQKTNFHISPGILESILKDR